jgi:hypothetical protein
MESEIRLPRGVFFEEDRNRYRVRLYFRQNVIWRSYHDNPAAALEALKSAREYRRSHARTCPRPKPPTLPQTVLDLLK